MKSSFYFLAGSSKLFTLDYLLVKYCYFLNQQNKRKTIWTKKRNCTIIPQFLNHKFKIYNGKSYISIVITEKMLGHKLGEFAYTRKLKTQKQIKKRSLLKINKK